MLASNDPEAILTPRQREANLLLSGPQRNTLLVGGSRSGKTFLFVRAMFIRALRTCCRQVIFRLRANAAKASLWLDTVPKVQTTCFAGLGLEYREVDRFVRFPNKSELWIAGLDDKARVEKILGMEFATIYFNEASQIPYHSIVLAQSRLAQKVEGLRNRCYYDLNPTGKGHYTYQQFILKKKPGTREDLPDPENFAYLFLNPRDNAQNIDADYITSLEGLPEKQRRRFLSGEYIDEIDGQLWTYELIESARITPDDMPAMRRIVIAVDPSGCSGDEDTRSDEVGIAAVGQGIDEDFYLLEDKTGRHNPEEWGRIAVGLYKKWHADKVIGEVNFGGDMVRSTVHAVDRNVAFGEVRASKGKAVRAEPISALYELGRVHHVGRFDQLEEQLTNFSTSGYMGPKSPNNADALVWGVTELAGGSPHGLLELWRQQKKAQEEKTATKPTEQIETTKPRDPVEVANAQKGKIDGWPMPKAVTPKMLGKVATSPKQTPVCTSCGNKFVSIFHESWRCGACGTTGALAA